MPNPLLCPKCQSAKTVDLGQHLAMFRQRKQLDSPEYKSLVEKLKGLGPMKPGSSGRQMCQDCMHMWDKPAPAFMFFLALAIGVGLCVPLVYVIATKNNDPGAIGGTVVIASLGCVCIFKSIQAMTGAKQKPKS